MKASQRFGIEGHVSAGFEAVMGTALTGDPRDVALRDAVYASIPPVKFQAAA